MNISQKMSSAEIARSNKSQAIVLSPSVSLFDHRRRNDEHNNHLTAVAGVGCELRRWQTDWLENISPMTGRVNDLVTKAGATRSTNGVDFYLLLKKKNLSR